jgi:tetratricopeptide (TPR) repeat protein
MALSSPSQEGSRSLDVLEFGTLLQVLAQTNKAGTLRVSSGSRVKLVSLENGRITRILTPRSRYRIGRVLYNLGALEIKDLKAVLEEIEGSGQPIGQALLQRGLITAAELEAALEFQMVEELLDVFHWKDLEYEFFEGAAEQEILRGTGDLTPVGGPREAQGLLLEVTRVLDETDKYRAATPSVHDVYEAVGDPVVYLQQEGAPERERETTLLLDGIRDLSEVVRDARMTRFEVRGLFYRLKSAGIIRPKNAFELLMLAENRQDSLSPTKRVRLLERAMELGLEGFDLAHRLAEIYEEMEDGPRAAARFLESARDMIRRGNRAAACESAARAVRADPSNTVVREFRARLLSESESDEEMVAEVLATAALHAGAGHPAEADRMIRAALARVPGHEQLLLARIDVLRALGRKRLASSSAIALARRQEQLRDMEGALTAIRRAVGIAPESFRARTAHIDLLLRMGDRSTAAAEVGVLADVAVRRLKQRPRRAGLVLGSLVERLANMGAVPSPSMDRIGEHYLALGEPQRALETFVRAGEARIAAGMWAQARKAFTRATDLKPNDVDLSETLALIHARMGDRDHAITRLTAIAAYLIENGEPERAEKAIREILGLNPYSPDALRELAHLKAELGRPVEAAELMHRLGYLFLASGDLDGAVESLDEACRLDPRNPRHFRALADSLARVLKTKRSIDTYESLLTKLRSSGDHIGALDVALRLLHIEPDHGPAAKVLETEYRLLGEQIRSATAASVSLPAESEQTANL